MGRIEQVEHGATQGEQRKGPHASRLGPALVRLELLEGEPEEQRKTQKKRQVGEQWQRSSERQGFPSGTSASGYNPSLTRPRLGPNSLPISDDRDPGGFGDAFRTSRDQSPCCGLRYAPDSGVLDLNERSGRSWAVSGTRPC